MKNYLALPLCLLVTTFGHPASGATANDPTSSLNWLIITLIAVLAGIGTFRSGRHW